MGRYSKQRPFAPFQKLLAGLGDQESSAFVTELNALAAAVAELSAEGKTSPDVPTGDSFNIKLGTKKFPEASTNELMLVVSPPLTGSLAGDKLTLGASIPTTDAVKTVSTDGAVPTGPFSVTGAGTVVLVEGANVTLTATQPSPGVVEVEVAAAGSGGGGGQPVFKSTSDCTPTGTAGCGNQVQAIWNSAVEYRRMLFDAASDKYLIVDDVPPDSWAGGTIYVRIYFGTGSAAITGNVIRWQVKVAGVTNNDLFSSAAHGTAVIGDVSSNVNSKKLHVDVGPITPSGSTSDQLFFEVGRIYAGVTDAHNGQISFYGLAIYYDGAPGA